MRRATRNGGVTVALVALLLGGCGRTATEPDPVEINQPNEPPTGSDPPTPPPTPPPPDPPTPPPPDPPTPPPPDPPTPPPPDPPTPPPPDPPTPPPPDPPTPPPPDPPTPPPPDPPTPPPPDPPTPPPPDPPTPPPPDPPTPPPPDPPTPPPPDPPTPPPPDPPTPPPPDPPTPPPPSSDPFAPTVVGITAPDSVVHGTSFQVVVHREWDCAVDHSMDVRWVEEDEDDDVVTMDGDHELRLTPRVRAAASCAPDPAWPAGHEPCVLTVVPTSNAPRDHFDVVAFSAGNQRVELRVRGGVAPRARGLVQRFEVRRRSGGAVNGAVITLTRAEAPYDVVGTAVTANGGRAQIVVPGTASEITVNETIRVSGGAQQYHHRLTIKRDHPLKTLIVVP